MFKPQVFVVEGSKPWFSDRWEDKYHVVNIDESVSGQATVTCEGVTTMRNMFDRCINLTSIHLSTFDTSDITDMADMFNSCLNLTSIDLSNFDTSNVKCMNHMFCNCPYITSLDISSFDTSNVEDMRDMFAHCIRLTTIKGVIDMEYCKYRTHMFYKCPKLTGITIKNPPLFAQW